MSAIAASLPAPQDLIQGDTLAIVNLGQIHKRPDHNPRKARSQRRMGEMRESIRLKGVLTPILLRPHPTIANEYELVAGETRYDLSEDVGLSQIPALIREVSDDEMLTLASTENLQRQDMVPVDEGIAAKALLERYHDKAEVCKILGWSASKLSARILLTHCVDAVAQSLCDEEISLGHAQLLSGLRPESQVGALTAIKENNLSIGDLRSLIEGMAQKLSTAVFKSPDCDGCPHNSSVQASLFDGAASGGNCMNKPCFDEKTQAQLQVIKSDLQESCNVVDLDTNVAKGSTIIIATSGSSGVGSEQFDECVNCQHYGALVGNQVGNIGEISHRVCFNTSCHTQKVADYRALVDTELASPSDNKGSNVVTIPGLDTTAAQPKSKKAKAKASAAAEATPKVTLERNHQVRRVAASEAVASEQRLTQIIAILSLLADSAVSFKTQPEGWPSNLSGSDRAKAARVLDTMSDDELSALQQQLTAKVMREASKFGVDSNGTDTFGSLAEWISETRKCDLSDHFLMDAEWIQPHTKPVIEQILTDSGFATDYDEGNGKGSFKKLIAGKKGDIIKAVSDSGFSFKGYLPKSLKAS